MKPELTEFSKALLALKEALAQPKNDLIRDATIQRFEFCVELAWKTAKKVLGSSSVGPRMIVREMAAQNLITDPEQWFGFLEARNLSSHTYREEIAEKVYTVAKGFLVQGEQLLKVMEKI